MIPLVCRDKEFDCGCGLSSEDIVSLMNGKAVTEFDWRYCLGDRVCRSCGEVHRHNFVRKRRVP